MARGAGSCLRRSRVSRVRRQFTEAGARARSEAQSFGAATAPEWHAPSIITAGTIPLEVVHARSFTRNPDLAPIEDIREEILKLEAEGEWIVQRVPDDHTE